MRIGLGVSIVAMAAVFYPSQLFSLAEPGVWYDPSDLTTLFQDTAGTQPVTTAGQAVALVLDKSQGLVLGSELFGGTFITSVAGGTATATESPAGTLNITGDGTNQARGDFSFSTVAGKSYRLTVTVSGSAASVVVGPTQGNNSIISGLLLNVGTNSLVFVASSTTTWVRYFKTGAVLASLSSTSVRELPGNHATQSILASRPLYALHPSSGIRNVANGSADVGNATYWPATRTENSVTATKVGSGIDTDGLPYVDYRYQGTATNTFVSGVYISSASRIGTVVGAQWTTSAILRVVGGSMSGVTGLRAMVVEETAPSTFVTNGLGNVVGGSTDELSQAVRTVATGNQVSAGLTLAVTNGATIDVTFRIKGLQLERGSTRTNYQFNYANFNIVEAPFAQLGNLLFDGVDDFLVTPTITPNTDKVQVFAGVRKLSDAARGMVAELGNATAGAFRLEAPNSTGVGNYLFTSGGSLAGAGIAAVNGFAAPDTGVLTGVGDIAADVAILRRNGSQVASSTADQGTGNYSNAPIYIGRRGGTTLPFNGRLYGLVVRLGPNLDAATIAATEAWMNTKTGAY